MLSELARQALNASAEEATRVDYGFRPLPSRGGVVTKALIDELADELES